MVHVVTNLSSLVLLSLSSLVTGYDRYAGYKPTHQITDQAAIDLDQEIFNEVLSMRQVNQAWTVYTQGGHSGSYAVLTLEIKSEAKDVFEAGTRVTGVTKSNVPVAGTLRKEVTLDGLSTSAEIEVIYDTGDSQADFVGCQVGGLTAVTITNANLTGCFVADGNVTLTKANATAGYNFTYSYNQHADNKNFRSMQSFSMDASTTMKGPNGQYYPEYQAFVDYYGDYNYADKWITAARNREPTEFKSGRGNNDFSLLSVRVGQGEAMKKGTAYLNIWMEAIREINEASAFCMVDSDQAEISTDQAVAYYAGSLTTKTGEEGILLYALAVVRAQQFRTAGHTGDKIAGDAWVNIQIFSLLKEMQGLVQKPDATLCAKAQQVKDQIIGYMKIPLIQGALRYAYMRDMEYPSKVEDQERLRTEGAVFGAAILPFVHQCGSREADVIHEALRVGGTPNYNEVANAFHRMYDCLGVTCEQVGAPWDDSKNGYKPGTDPCSIIKTKSNGGAIFGKFLGFSVAFILCGWLFLRYRHRCNSGRRRKHTYPEMHSGNIAAVTEIA